MDYVARLLEDAEYTELLRELEELEAERIYCRHGFEHLMDVARLGWIHALEEGIAVEKEQFYLAALLHDIGRVDEYKTGISHADAGCRRAGEILLRIGCKSEWIESISKAILYHRGSDASNELGELLQRTDKEVRPCFYCKASNSCKWGEDKKNITNRWQ